MNYLNSRGQIGQILTSFPALIFVFMIMLIFVAISGFLGKDLANASIVECDSSITPEQRLMIQQNFPSKNAESGSLIDKFLRASIKVGEDFVTVQCAIEKMCSAGLTNSGNNLILPTLPENLYNSANINLILNSKSSPFISNSGKFAIISQQSTSDYNLINEIKTIFSSNTALKMDASYQEFSEIFESPKLQKKTLCSLPEIVTLYVLPEGFK